MGILVLFLDLAIPLAIQHVVMVFVLPLKIVTMIILPLETAVVEVARLKLDIPASLKLSQINAIYVVME